MSKFSASDAAFSGFRLVRENLRSVSVWMLIMTVTSIISSIVMIHFFGKEMNAFSAAIPAPGAEPDLEKMQQALEGMMPALLFSLPYTTLIYGVLYAGVNRLVQRPHDKGFAHLRLGMDEVRQAAVWALYSLVLFTIFVFGNTLSRVLLTIAGPGGALLALLVLIASISCAIYLAVRLSVAMAATFAEGRIVFLKSMPLTKGHFWPMLGAYFLAVVMCVIVFLLLMAVVSGVAAIISGSLETSAKLIQADTTSLKVLLSPMGMAQSLLSGVWSVLTNLILFTPIPTIYMALKGGGEAQPTSNGNW
jgi:hypothetical protein